jgi:prepilin-type N-terminal cleavage/methylation domain-containing protein
MNRRSGVTETLRAPDAGFTLLEVLTVLAISALIFLLLDQGIRFSFVAWDRQSGELSRDEDITTFDETVRRLVGAIDPGLSAADPPLFEGSAHAVRFISDDRVFTIGVNATQALTLEWTSPFSTLTRDPRVGVSTLMEGVERLDIHYWRPNVGWTGIWSGPRPPSLIRFHIEFPSETGRHVPDLIASPIREAWRS